MQGPVIHWADSPFYPVALNRQQSVHPRAQREALMEHAVGLATSGRTLESLSAFRALIEARNGQAKTEDE